MRNIFLILSIAIFAVSCKNDDTQTSATPGTVNINFQNKVGNQSLILNAEGYANLSGETYTVSELKYIVSNIVFIDADGNEFAYPQAESYFVVNQADENSKKLALTNVAGGIYAKVRFGIGVDQSNYPLNGSNDFIPTADENGMLWSWSAGYKFLKFEGRFSGPTLTDKPFNLHIGSHGTNQDNYREITMPINAINVSSESTNNLTLTMDVAKIFDGVAAFSLEEKSDVQVDPVYAPKLINNFQASFSVNQ